MLDFAKEKAVPLVALVGVFVLAGLRIVPADLAIGVVTGIILGSPQMLPKAAKP